MKNEIVLFTDGGINIEVQINPEQETVWLTQKQMGELFNVKQATLSEHINNIISSGELNETSIGFSDKSSGGRKPKIYNFGNRKSRFAQFLNSTQTAISVVPLPVLCW